MNKQIVFVALMALAITLEALGQSPQSNPWGCNSSTNTHLICLVPLATRSIGASGSPASTFNSAFATQLSELPLLSPASGVIFTFDKSLGMTSPSENLGPILTERAHTIGKHKLLVAFAYQRFRFNSIDGNSLGALPFVFPASQGQGGTQYTQLTEDINFKLDQYVGLITYGLTSKVDISVLIPLERVSIGASALNQTVYSVGTNGQATGQVPLVNQYTPGSASGIGDVLVNGKWRFWSGEKSNLAAGLLIRFPSGDALNYLGSGAYGFNPYAVFSYDARLSPHARVGYQFNTSTVLLPVPDSSGKYLYPNSIGNYGLPGGLQYNIGADYVLFKKVLTSVTADFLGTYIVNSPILLRSTVGAAYSPLSAAFPDNVPQSSPALITGKTSYGSNQLSLGVKMKPVKTFLLYGNVLFQLNNVGLRSNPVPLIGASYTF